MNYEINEETLAILPLEGNKCRAVEKENEYYIESKSFSVVEHSCEYFGSSYSGRHNGTKKLTGLKYKSPILVEESTRLIVFPTHSPRNEECIWLVLNKIKKCYPSKITNMSIIEFISGDKLEIDVSYQIINNQILRATRLKVLIEERLKLLQK